MTKLKPFKKYYPVYVFGSVTVISCIIALTFLLLPAKDEGFGSILAMYNALPYVALTLLFAGITLVTMNFYDIQEKKEVLKDE